MDFLHPLWRFLLAQPWAIPVTGALAASLAFMVGRRWFSHRPAPTPPPPPPLEEGRTKLITASVTKASAPDRRSSPRRKGNRVEVSITDDTKTDSLYGWVVDRSMGGLCLVVEKPLSEGTLLNVRPRKAPQTAPWLSIEIRSCRPEGDEWEVGCRFTKPPQWNDLLLFG